MSSWRILKSASDKYGTTGTMAPRLTGILLLLAAAGVAGRSEDLSSDSTVSQELRALITSLRELGEAQKLWGRVIAAFLTMQKEKDAALVGFLKAQQRRDDALAEYLMAQKEERRLGTATQGSQITATTKKRRRQKQKKNENRMNSRPKATTRITTMSTTPAPRWGMWWNPSANKTTPTTRPMTLPMTSPLTSPVTTPMTTPSSLWGNLWWNSFANWGTTTTAPTIPRRTTTTGPPVTRGRDPLPWPPEEQAGIHLKCGRSFTQVGNNSCLHLYQIKTSWEEARKICHSLRGDLFHPTDEDGYSLHDYLTEYDGHTPPVFIFLEHAMKGLGKDGLQVWLGASVDQDGRTKWISGGELPRGPNYTWKDEYGECVVASVKPFGKFKVWTPFCTNRAFPLCQREPRIDKRGRVKPRRHMDRSVREMPSG